MSVFSTVVRFFRNSRMAFVLLSACAAAGCASAPGGAPEPAVPTQTVRVEVQDEVGPSSSRRSFQGQKA